MFKNYGTLTFHPTKNLKNRLDDFYQKMNGFCLTYKTISNPHLSNDQTLLFNNVFSYVEDKNFKMLTISVFDENHQFKAPLSLLEDIKRNFIVKNL